MVVATLIAGSALSRRGWTMSPPRVLEPLRREPTPVLISRKLRAAIASGELAPGQRLVEADLSQRLGVSRGLLREAMQRLIQEGLLEGVRNRGIVVARLGGDEVRDIFIARSAVEHAAGQTAITLHGASVDLGTVLLDLCEQMAADADTMSADDLDLRFHGELVAAARSPRLSRMHETLMTETRMCLASLSPIAYPTADRVAEHRGIAEAVAAGDADLLRQRLSAHMEAAVRRSVERMAELAPQG